MATEQPTQRRRGVRVRCPLGGYAPCIDDLCHGGAFVCGLDGDFDVCPHGFIPETCPDCDDERGDEFDDFGFDDEGRPEP